MSRLRAHLDDLYRYELSEQTISNITDKIIDVAKEWHVAKRNPAVKRGQNRLLKSIYHIIFLKENANTKRDYGKII